jgi:hypothetical protein
MSLISETRLASKSLPDVRSAGFCVIAGLSMFAGIILAAAGTSLGSELSSASYRSVGGAINAGSAAMFSTAVSPAFSGAAGSLGQREAIGPSGGSSDLTTSWPGFWAIVVRGSASLDLDGDGIQSFLDDDDDNDGLLDDVETNTRVFVSESDTGTDPLVADTDGDGVDDGSEISAGSDPNNPFSIPMVPALTDWGRAFAVMALASVAGIALRGRRIRCSFKT